MKKFFAKESFLFSSFERKSKSQSLIVSLVLIAFFLICSYTFFMMLYSFADILGSIVSGSPDVAIRDLLRAFPLFLAFFMTFWTVLLLQSVRRGVDEEHRYKAIFKKGIVILCFGAINIIYIIVGRITGRYSSLVEGSPTYIYPLDSFLYSILFVLIGVASIIYVKRFKEKLPLEVPLRGVAATKHKPVRFIYCFGVSFWTLIALFGFSGAMLTLFAYDFSSGYVFFGIVVFFIYLLSPVLLALWEFYYGELKEEKKKEFFLPLSICSLAVSALLVVLYFVSLSSNMDAPSNAGFGMFPITFTANANYGTLIVVFTPLIVSIVAFIRAIISKLKK